MRNGQVEEESRQRTRAKSLQYLAAKVREAGPLERLALMNGNAPDFQVLVDMLAGVEVARPMVLSELGPVVAAHAGLGAVGAAWARAAG